MQCHHRVATRCVGEGISWCNFRSFGKSCAIPSEAIASKGSSITCVAMSNSQMQCHHRVATRCVGKSISGGNFRSFGIGRTIPVKTVAGESGSIAGIAVSDSQMQCYHRVTTRSIGKSMSRSNFRSFGICCAIPCEAIACECSGISSVAVSDSQVQCHHRVATRGIGEGMGRCYIWSFGIGCSVPCETVAGKGSSITSVAMSDSQMQCHHRVATRCVGKGISGSNFRSFGIGRTIPVKTVAGESGSIAGIAVSDSQMQCYHRVTTRSIGKSMSRSNFRSFGICCAIPCEAIACECSGISSVAVSDSQVQCHHRVATRCIGEGMSGSNFRSFGISCAIPCEAIACECSGISSVAVTYGQMKRYHRIATHCIGKGVR